MARIGVACGLTFLLSLQLAAVSSGRKLPGYSRRVWQTQDGLPEQTVQAFAQTPDRFLWIGTTGGLIRFDGSQFVVLDRDNSPYLHDNSVFCLMVSTDGSLWIGTDGGGLARQKQGAVRSYSYKEGLTNEFVRAIFQDHKGDVWVGTDDGLFRVKGEALERVDGRAGVPPLAVHAIREDSRGRLWIGGSSLIMLDGTAAKEYPLEGGFGENRVKSILETSDGTLWVGTVSGLQRRERNAAGFTRVEQISSTVRVLREDSGGSLWIGTIGEGIIRYRDGRFTKLTAPEYLPSDTVLSMFEDVEQNVWVGTQTGLLRLSRTPVSTYPIPGAEDSDFGTISQDRDGALWVASSHLYRLAGGDAVPYRFAGQLAGIKVRNLFRDSAGALWVGTDGHGVFRVDGPRTEHYTARQGLVNDFIRVFYESAHGGIWIGTDEGLSRWRAGAITNYRVRDGLCYFSIRALLEDRAGDLWIGTERGVSRLHGGAFVRDAITDRLQHEKVWAIHEDPEGGLWFGTRGAGLFRWKAGNITVYTTAQGLASNSIFHIIEDHNGKFWMSGPNGISSINRRDLDAIARDRSYRPAVELYGVSDGLATTQMHGGTQPAGCLTARGEVWFPSNKGPVRILPDQARAAEVSPAIIERVVADGRDMPLTEKLNLPPGDGKLEIHYSAVRLRSQERIRFKYKLEGFDGDWTEASGRRVAYYTNLPPGQYRFRVAAFEMSDPRKTSEASMTMEWRPHFYRTPWFFVFCLVSLGAAVWGAHQFQMRQARVRFEGVLEERNRVAREMHDTLIQGCGSISALLEASFALGDSAANTKRELLEYARDQVRTTMDEARRAVWNLRQQKPGIGIAAILAEISQQVSAETRIPISCQASGRPFDLDQQTEHDVSMVAREALHNAAQHGNPDRMQVQLSFEARKLRMEISDNGCGFKAAARPVDREHYGLTFMRERIEGLGGSIVIRSSPGQGTRIEATIPRRNGRGGGGEAT